MVKLRFNRGGQTFEFPISLSQVGEWGREGSLKGDGLTAVAMFAGMHHGSCIHL